MSLLFDMPPPDFSKFKIKPISFKVKTKKGRIRGTSNAHHSYFSESRSKLIEFLCSTKNTQ